MLYFLFFVDSVKSNSIRMKFFLSSLFCFMVCSAVCAQQNIRGAWTFKQDSITHLVLVTPAYYSYSVFAPQGFIHTEGGAWRGFSGTNAVETVTEFNSSDITRVREKLTDSSFFSRFHHGLNNAVPAGQWQRNTAADAAVDAVWRISGRVQEGDMKSIPEGARKTIKLLAGGWFHWAAINTATGEFFGTGGGRFSYVPGSYTEQIDFFSRDNSRVGLSLQFSDQIANGKWDHQGKSTKGDPIHEIWTRED